MAPVVLVIITPEALERGCAQQICMKIAARFKLQGMRQLVLSPADAEAVGALGNGPCLATGWDLGEEELSAFATFLGPAVGSVTFEFGSSTVLGPFQGSVVDRCLGESKGQSVKKLVGQVSAQNKTDVAAVTAKPSVPSIIRGGWQEAEQRANAAAEKVRELKAGGNKSD